MNLLRMFDFGKKQKLISYLDFVPQEYASLGEQGDSSHIDSLTRSLEKKETHNSPNQYSDWYSIILNVTHPSRTPHIESERVKSLSGEVSQIFSRASTNFPIQFRKLKEQMFSSLPENHKKSLGATYFLDSSYICGLQIMPEIDVSLDAPENAHLLRYKGGLSAYQVAIDPKWVQTFDQIARWGKINETINWYEESFKVASKVGRLLG